MAMQNLTDSGRFEVKLLHAIEKKESMVQALKQCPEIEKKQEILRQLAELEGCIADECAAELLSVEHDQFVELVRKASKELLKNKAYRV